MKVSGNLEHDWGPFFGAEMAGPVTLYILLKKNMKQLGILMTYLSLLQEMPFGEVVGEPQSCLSIDLFMEILTGNYP